MTILKTDIKLFASKNMSDDDNGGGGITNNAILDGSLNALFVGMSRLDKTLGRVSIRFGNINIATDNNDTYYACHVIIDKPQNDPDISLLMMKASHDFETRIEAEQEIAAAIDLSETTESLWFHASFEAGGQKNQYSAKFQSQLVPEGQFNQLSRSNVGSTFPEFFAGKSIFISDTEYQITSVSSTKFSFTIVLSSNLTSNANVDDVVKDEELQTRWAISEAVLAGESQVNIKHVTYQPGIGESVIIDNQLMEITAIDNTIWTDPVFTFSEPFNKTIAINSVIKTLVPNEKIKYYGVTNLSADAVADDLIITASETSQFIFPVGSSGIDPTLIGLNSELLPANRRVNIIQQNSVIVIHATDDEPIANPAVSDTTYNLTGSDYQLIELVDQDNLKVNPVLYTFDGELASITMASAIDLSPYNQPLIAQKRHENIRLVKTVNHSTKSVTLFKPLTHDFLSANTYISTALIFGDIRSHVAFLFDQETWLGQWSDTVNGNSASGTVNDADFPVVLTNAGAVTENWAFVFDSPTTFVIIGERLGQIGTGQINGAQGSFVNVVNILTGLDYFKFPQEAFGLGYSTGNAIRFKTVSCSRPIRFIRVTQQGDQAQELTDNFVVMIRGDSQ